VGYYERQQDLGKKMLYLEKMGEREFNDELANIIRDYWSQQGKSVEVKVMIQQTSEKKQPVWVICSNMIDGVPKCVHKSSE
jgi:hypothetical protein